MIDSILLIAAKAALGGLLVVVFAVFAETLSPKRFAGVFAAAPSVALASLLVTVMDKGPEDAREACLGMTAGAVGFVGYGLVAPMVMRSWGAARGAATALLGWVLVTAAVLPLAVASPAATAGFAAATPPGKRARHRPVLRCEPGKVQKTQAKDWLIRFTFGAATSGVAAVLSIVIGPVIAGTLLAFPAILLASLTLVAKEDGRAQARDDARGAAAGAVGLIAFAVVGAATFHSLPTLAVFGLITGTWLIVGPGAYAVAWLAGAGADEDH